MKYFKAQIFQAFHPNPEGRSMKNQVSLQGLRVKT
jgi:hypothetical protein